MRMSKVLVGMLCGVALLVGAAPSVFAGAHTVASYSYSAAPDVNPDEPNNALTDGITWGICDAFYNMTPTYEDPLSVTWSAAQSLEIIFDLGSVKGLADAKVTYIHFPYFGYNGVAQATFEFATVDPIADPNNWGGAITDTSFENYYWGTPPYMNRTNISTAGSARWIKATLAIGAGCALSEIEFTDPDKVEIFYHYFRSDLSQYARNLSDNYWNLKALGTRGPLAGSAGLSVTATCPNGALAYQWYAEDTLLTDGAKYSGVNTNTLTVSTLELTDADPNYYCVVTSSTDGVGEVSLDQFIQVNTTGFVAPYYELVPVPATGIGPCATWQADENYRTLTDGVISSTAYGDPESMTWDMPGGVDGPTMYFDLGAVGPMGDAIIYYWTWPAGGLWEPTSVTIDFSDLADPEREIITDMTDWSGTLVFTGWPTGDNVPQSKILGLADAGNHRWVRMRWLFPDPGYVPWDTFSEVTFIDPAGLISIDSDPQDALVLEGQTAQFGITVSGGGAPRTYQWKKDGVALVNGGDISGADTNTLTIANCEAADEGAYSCFVTGPDDPGGAESATASLTVLVPGCYSKRVLATGPIAYYAFDEPNTSAIALDLVSGDAGKQLTAVTPVRTLHAGYGGAVDTSAGNTIVQPVTVGVWGGNPDISVAEGNGYAMEWMMKWNGSAERGNVLRSPTDNGTAEFGSLWGAPEWGLQVYVQPGYNNMMLDRALEDPNFLDQWHHMVWTQASDGTGTLYVDGVANTSWFWRLDPAPTVSGALNFSSLEVGGSPPHPTYGAAFRGEVDEVAIYDLSGAADQAAAAAVIASHAVSTGAAYVVQDPVDVTGVDPAASATVTFSVVAAGACDITYQWKKDDVVINNGAKYAGTTGSVLTLSDVVIADEGVYTCDVANGEGGATSAGATLDVDCYWDIPGDFDGDCDKDLADLAEFLDWWLADSTTPL